MLKYCVIFILIYSTQVFSSSDVKKVSNSKVQDSSIANDIVIPLGKGTKQEFKLKKVLKNKSKLEKFIEKNLSTIQFESRKEVTEFLNKNTRHYFFHGLFKNNELLSEFIFQAFRHPDKTSKTLSFVLQFNKMIGFFVFLIASMAFSGYLSEKKYQYDIFSLERLSFVSLQFLGINTLRFGVFFVCFKDQFLSFLDLGVKTMVGVQSSYPIISPLIQNFYNLF